MNDFYMLIVIAFTIHMVIKPSWIYGFLLDFVMICALFQKKYIYTFEWKKEELEWVFGNIFSFFGFDCNWKYAITTFLHTWYSVIKQGNFCKWAWSQKLASQKAFSLINYLVFNQCRMVELKALFLSQLFDWHNTLIWF